MLSIVLFVAACNSFACKDKWFCWCNSLSSSKLGASIRDPYPGIPEPARTMEVDMGKSKERVHLTSFAATAFKIHKVQEQDVQEALKEYLDAGSKENIFSSKNGITLFVSRADHEGGNMLELRDAINAHKDGILPEK